MRSATNNATGIVVGQRVTDEKRQRARELRMHMTSAEGLLWSALRGRRLAGLRFRRQQIIDGFIADFYCDAARLVVEVDGVVHNQQQGHDEARDEIFAGRELRVLRFTNDDVEQRLELVLQYIATIAEQEGRVPTEISGQRPVPGQSDQFDAAPPLRAGAGAGG